MKKQREFEVPIPTTILKEHPHAFTASVPKAQRYINQGYQRVGMMTNTLGHQLVVLARAPRPAPKLEVPPKDSEKKKPAAKPAVEGEDGAES